MSCNRGDLVLVWFPQSDLKTVTRRPALVVQADGLNTALPQIVLAMVTSNLARLGHPSRVLIPRLLPSGVRSGLLTDSVVMTDNLATVLVKAIDRVLGRVPDMSGVDTALRSTLGL